MKQLSDNQLIERYRRNQDEKAFALLVERHLDLVYGTALRRVRSSHLAEEICQAVFLELAKVAGTFSNTSFICTWLHRVARNKSVDLVRRECNRKKHESIAAENHDSSSDTQQWADIEPMLDEAIETLNEQDRTAVILRYFESKSFKEIGHVLGASEEAARKRVHRSIQRLWQYFKKNGFGIHTSDFESLLTTRATILAPVGLIVSVCSVVQSFAAPTALTIAAQVFTMTSLKKAVFAGVLMLSVGTCIHLNHRSNELKHRADLYRTDLATLTSEHDKQSQLLKSAHAELERLKRDLNDLHRLRGEVSQYRADAERLKRLQTERTYAKTTAGILEFRVNKLKEKFHSIPNAWIPEMDLLDDFDWFFSVRHEIDNEAQMRYTMSSLRRIAERKLTNQMSESLTEFKQSTGKEFPENIQELVPFLDDKMDKEMLSRWEVVPESSLDGIRMSGTEFVITQKEPVDEIFDDRLVIGSHGQGSTDFLGDSRQLISKIFATYRTANDGALPDLNSLDLLRAYVSTDEERMALEKRILRSSVQRYE